MECNILIVMDCVNVDVVHDLTLQNIDRVTNLFKCLMQRSTDRFSITLTSSRKSPYAGSTNYSA